MQYFSGFAGDQEKENKKELKYFFIVSPAGIEQNNMILYNQIMEAKQNKNSAAKIKANNKYTKDHYKRYAVYVPIDEAERMEAAKGGGSANSFILEAIREKINDIENRKDN